MMKNSNLKSDRKFKNKDNTRNQEPKEATKETVISNETSYHPEEFDVEFNKSENANKTKTTSNTEIVSKPIPLQVDNSSIYNSELFDFNDSFKSLGVTIKKPIIFNLF